MAAGIRSIAKHLGVSISTVSAVINGRGYVSPEMKERIEKYLREVDYEPNYVARSLRRKETRMVGLIVPDLSNNFYSELSRGAEDSLMAHDYRLLVADSREDWNRQRDYLIAFCRMMTDGILLVPSLATDDQVASITGLVQDRPLVYVDRSPPDPPVDAVMIDNREAARTAVTYLTKRGHKRIAIITEPLNLLNANDRLEGYRQAIAEASLSPKKRLIRTGRNTRESGYQIGLELMDGDPRPTAVLICNNLMTLGFLSALRVRGVTCPECISIIGFDDCDWSEHVCPSLTTIQAPAEEMGATAANALLTRIMQQKTTPPATTLLGFRLIERSSVAPQSVAGQTS